MNNEKNRLHDVFFYGLYMDEDILKSKGVKIRNQRAASVDNYSLRVGKMATLLREDSKKAFGLIYSLTHEEIYSLYEGSGLISYKSESLLAKTLDNKTLCVLSCNLLNPPKDDEKNDEYLKKLFICMKKYNLPLPKES